jgi:hypothetical protein
MEQLTERESQALEHLRKAEELEVTIAEYARSFEIDVKDLYASKQSLIRKGALPGRPAGGEDQLSDFVPVQVTPSSSHADVVCRIRHPSGLLIECASWPPAKWISQLVGA